MRNEDKMTTTVPKWVRWVALEVSFYIALALVWYFFLANEVGIEALLIPVAAFHFLMRDQRRKSKRE